MIMNVTPNPAFNLTKAQRKALLDQLQYSAQYNVQFKRYPQFTPAPRTPPRTFRSFWNDPKCVRKWQCRWVRSNNDRGKILGLGWDWGPPSFFGQEQFRAWITLEFGLRGFRLGVQIVEELLEGDARPISGA